MSRGKFVIIILLCLAVGLGLGVFNRLPVLERGLDYLKCRWRGEQYINPRATLKADREYLIEIFYYPLFRLPGSGNRGEELVDDEEYIRIINQQIEEEYPNFKLEWKMLDYRNGADKLQARLKKGDPPDIYWNIDNDDYLSPDWQLPVEAYISREIRPYYWTVDWTGIDHNNHLWGWPLLVQPQAWYGSGSKVEFPAHSVDFWDWFVEQGPGLIVNYYDEDFFRQLLTINGFKQSQMGDDRLSDQNCRAIIKTFSDLEKLDDQGRLKAGVDRGLREFFNESEAIWVPANLWLGSYLEQKECWRLPLPGIYSQLSLLVFRQQQYRGDDHTRAVMEVASRLTRELSPYPAERLGLLPAYNPQGIPGNFPGLKQGIRPTKLPGLTPEIRIKWERELWPLWIMYWEQELTLAEIRQKLEKGDQS